MDKSPYSHQQEVLRALLRDLRQEAGLRQQDVAEAIKEPQSFVSKYENGERRLDILELRQVCIALGYSLVEFAEELEIRLKRRK